MDHPEENFQKWSSYTDMLNDEGFYLKKTPGRSNKWIERNRRQYLAWLRDTLNHYFPSVPLLGAFFRILNAHDYPKFRNVRKSLFQGCWPGVQRWFWMQKGSKTEIEEVEEINDDDFPEVKLVKKKEGT
eukprot:Pompholyxophrys_punicea_v1_NODE_1624_length_615_cov_1.676786.p1 type:complete len:129 gc:universal NODE_1624_length_615_cov_1.676786:165-551(+)